jgi:hypothetical protein
MLKNPSLLAAITAVFLFQACKKNNDTPADSSSYPKTYIEDIRITGYNSLTTYNLSYDGNGRMISMTAIPEPAIVKFLYNYTSASTFTMDLYNSNALSIHENLWLNTSSNLDSTFQYNDTGDSSTEKYVYNSDKQLLQIKNYNYHSAGSVPDHTVDYTYDNMGNVTQESNSQGTTVSYTYYTDLPNTLRLGKEFLPQAKYFIKTASSSSGGTPVTATHYYSFDGSNRLAKDSAVTTGVDAIVIKSYTY